MASIIKKGILMAPVMGCFLTKMTRVYISESKFKSDLKLKLKNFDATGLNFVTGPGRSGAIASVYVSHMTSLSFVPYKTGGNFLYDKFLIVDTAAMSGRTIRQANNFYKGSKMLVVYNDPEIRHVFWYERDYKEI